MKSPLRSNQLLMYMALILFALGAASFATGLFVLVWRAGGKDIRQLAAQAGNLAQKGFAEDIAGLVGNASALLEATEQLVQTTAGIGVFLILAGVLLMGTSVFLVLRFA